MAPHAQSQVVGAGRCVPHSGQKCPCSALAPHVGLGQSHVSGAGRGAHGGRDGLARRLAHGPHHPEGEAELHNLADGGATAAGTAPGADDAVLHGLLAHLALRLLLIGVALHTHLLGFGRGHAAHGFGLAAGLDGTDACLGLRLHGQPFGLGLRLALADLLLADPQVEIGVLLAQTLIVGVVVRRDHAADDELRRLQAILGEFPVDVRAQRLGELREVFVHLQDVDGAFADAARQTALHLRHDQRAEEGLGVSGGPEQLRRAQIPPRTDDLLQELAGIRHAYVELTARAQFHVQAGAGVEEPHLGIRPPLQAQHRRQIDEVDLRVEHLPLRGVRRRDTAHQGQTLRLQGVPTWPETVQRAAVPEEDRLLVLMDDQLRTVQEVLDGVLPDQDVLLALELEHRREVACLGLGPRHRHRHVVRVPAQRAHGRRRGLLHVQGQAALLAGDLRVLPLERRGVDGLATDRADGLLPLALVEDHHVAALLAAAAGQLLGLDVNHVPAAARLLPEPKEPQERLSSPVAKRVASRK